MQTVRFAPAVLAFTVGCVHVPVESSGPTLAEQDLAVMSQHLTEFQLKLVGRVACTAQCSVTRAEYEWVIDGKVMSTDQRNFNATPGTADATSFSIVQTAPFAKTADELKALDARGGTQVATLRGKVFVVQNERTYALDFARSKEVRLPRLPHIKLLDFDAGRYSENEAGVIFHIGVVNANPFDVPVAAIEYTAAVAGKTLNEGVLAKGERVAQASTGAFDIEVRIDSTTFGDTEARKLIKSRVLPYSIKGRMTSELFVEDFEFKGDVKLNVSK